MINQLKLYNVGEKIRVGSPNDGGYVLPKSMIDLSSCLFSYGISNDINFDEHYISLTQKNVHGYDHTIDGVHTNYPDLFTLYKKGISGTTEADTANFLQHYKDLNLSDKVLLKVDVEGCEYEWLENTNIAELASLITGTVIEFHYLANHEYRERFIRVVTELNNYFYLCHVHGNNCGGQFLYVHNGKEVLVPEVLELTFINKQLATFIELDSSSYPGSLDAPNNYTLPDYDLPFVNFNKN
jgi:hypothetical protein